MRLASQSEAWMRAGWRLRRQSMDWIFDRNTGRTNPDKERRDIHKWCRWHIA